MVSFNGPALLLHVYIDNCENLPKGGVIVAVCTISGDNERTLGSDFWPTVSVAAVRKNRSLECLVFY